MVTLSEPARAVVESDALGHLVTVNPDGSPQVSCVWVGLDGDELVFGSIGPRQKIHNIRRDPRVVVSLETDQANEMGLRQYLVVHGSARVEDGGAPDLLQRLARIYLGPTVRFPPMDDPPAGHVIRITPERVSGVGPWG
ncbi:MAG: PPOX class F420-dependent oxidoreductase [Actinomycetota bacterium]|nr:PPOX class F420-dependent oxidoreductase [Actinomycetota bacterium]